MDKPCKRCAGELRCTLSIYKHCKELKKYESFIELQEKNKGMPLMTIKQLVEPQFVVDYENIQEVNNENN